MAPQQPPPPEIEGFLKKLKRKTSNLSGSWNKRWFFVDPKRREFGYAKTKAPDAPKSSIYLNDITAVVQFDDTHFQVESRTRNFFLCGESKASTTCWVKSLDEYRKKMAEYEKEKARYDAIVQAQMLPPDAKTEVASSTLASKVVTRKATPSSNNKGLASGSSHARPSDDEPSRDSFSSSPSSSSGSSVSSPSLKRASRATERQARVERRSPSPAETPPKEKRRERERTDGEKKSDRSRERDQARDHDHRGHEREREREKYRSREREREKDHSHEQERGRNERSPSSSSRSRSKPSAGSRTNSRLQFENRSIGDASSVRAHPGKGYVMQAWADDDI
uniref:PH domain-containing protein n=1 Tax=Globisporangium ultimum (strain ATCC 200006 / CBS 805.95 / DAOM BR144) TaxID=431595 RepID=K3X6M0_GLOUD